jgi:UDP-N-acetylmuramate dehydrogenase
MIKIQENVDTKDYSTFKIGGQFRYFVRIKDKEELSQLYTVVQNDGKYKNIPIFILGSGSNIVFSDGVLEGLFVKNEIEGFEILEENDEYVDIKVGAGLSWDYLVQRSIEMNLSGIEALSIIPGTVGASPVQNIGAYGAEVKDVILNVEVFDPHKNEFKIISNLDCKFGYRDSIFKNEAKGKYIITSVTYHLSKGQPKIPNYPDVLKYFTDKNISNPTLYDIREAIVYIRNNKLPDFRNIPNVGSFFKNPFVKNDVVEKLKINYPNIKIFPVDENYSKVPAGWLIENAGFKGKSFGSISIYDKNALVLVNNGGASYQDLINTKKEIIRNVEQKFGIILEQEPEIIG